ncbi:hypothetical protein IJ541_09830 [bacterium]|nr:hypothetical protein [bacterium]
MIDSSAKYGLYNPAFTEDIGNVMLGRMVGNDIDLDDYRISGVTGSMDGVNIQGNLPSDKVELSTKQKAKKVAKYALIAAGVIAAGLLAFKGFKGGIKKFPENMKNLFDSIVKKFKK